MNIVYKNMNMNTPNKLSLIIKWLLAGIVIILQLFTSLLLFSEYFSNQEKFIIKVIETKSTLANKFLSGLAANL